ncbi:MAG: sugar phosphate isomerase/epimerase [Ruminococcaceae bacterium]|nr:sugar phosphate isomerase/epimerase [Oscillospiraceae bacterium]
MKLASTTCDFEFCPTDYPERITHLYNAGFRHIDLNMMDPKPDDPLIFADDWQQTAKALLTQAQSLGMDFVQAHAPGDNPISPFNADYTARVIRSIEVCAYLGIKNTVIHPGSLPDISKEECFERNRAFFRTILPTAEGYGVNILVENMYRVGDSDEYNLYTGADQREFIEFVNHPLLHACWDTGHGNMDGLQYDHITALGEHLYALHVNDNRGEKDEHLAPYMGILNLDDLMCALLDIGYQGYFTFEAVTALHPANYWFDTRYEFPRFTRLVAPSPEVYEAYDTFLCRLGKHILTTYDCFEE